MKFGPGIYGHRHGLAVRRRRASSRPARTFEPIPSFDPTCNSRNSGDRQTSDHAATVTEPLNAALIGQPECGPARCTSLNCLQVTSSLRYGRRSDGRLQAAEADPFARRLRRRRRQGADATLPVRNISVSLDAFGTGEGQKLDAPFGHAGMRLVEWALPM